MASFHASVPTTVLAPRDAPSSPRRSSTTAAALLAGITLATLSQFASATVLFDNYRGSLRVSGAAQAPNYINDNGAHTGLTNLINFATANPSNIASSGSDANIDWLQTSYQLCNTEAADGLAAASCVNQIQGRRIYALVKFPAAGTYTFQAAHDDELEIDFSTNYSSTNAGNYRNFDYNVPVGSLAAYTGGDGSYETVPGNFVVPQAGACYVMRVYWNNRGGKNFLRMRWKQDNGAFATVPAESLLDPSQSASYASCVNLQTDLGVQKTGPATFTANPDGSTVPFNYTIKVWNQGPVATSAATVADTLPANVDIVGAPVCTPSGAATCGGFSNTGKAYVMATGNLPVNASPDPKVAPSSGDYLTYTFTVKPTTTAVSITNTATITVNDLDVSNNSSSVTTTKQGLVSVAKTGPDTVVAGQLFNYTITVTNGRDQALATPVVAEQMPANMTAMSILGATCTPMPSAGGALLTCTLPASIPPGGSASFTIRTRADTPGSVTNYVSTDPQGSTTPGTPGSNCTQTKYSCASAKTDVTPAPAVSIRKYFNPTTIPVGGVSVLYIVIDNTASASWLTEVKIKDVLPPNVFTYDTESYTNCGGTLSASADQTAITLTRGAIKGGTQCFMAWQVTSSEVGPHLNTIPANNVSSLEGASNLVEASATLQVNAPSAINTIKKLRLVNGQPVPANYRAQPGHQLTYAITVTNSGGPGSTTLTETVPAGTTYSGNAATEGWGNPSTCAAAASTCTQVVPLPDQTPKTVNFTVTVEQLGDATAIANEVSSDNGDCSSCTVITPIAAADMQATGATTQEVPVGTPVEITTTCTNAGPNSALNVTCAVTGGPADAVTVCTPKVPVASLPVGGTITCVTSFTPKVTGSVILITTTGTDSADPFPDNNVDNSSLTVIDQVVQEGSTPVPIDARWMLALLALAVTLLAGWKLRRR